MARQAERHSKSTSVRRLRKTLQVLADTSPQASFREAEEYICTVCNLAIKPCEADSRAKCFHMLREATELQVLSSSAKEERRQCLSCGKLLTRQWLQKNPTAELCHTCTKKSTSMKKRTLSKGILP